jgi:hypothetical protein
MKAAAAATAFLFCPGKCMYLSGLLPRPMCSDDDQKLLDFGIGFTNIVERTTRGSATLTRQEIVEGKNVVKKMLETMLAFHQRLCGVYLFYFLLLTIF